ncbi:MAG: c-type cytochrome, partial [Nitrospinota bacterium]
MKNERWNRIVVGTMGAVLAVGLVAVWASPAAAADAAAGKAIYGQRCAVCHGKTGESDTPMAKMLKPPPASFADAQYM